MIGLYLLNELLSFNLVFALFLVLLFVLLFPLLFLAVPTRRFYFGFNFLAKRSLLLYKVGLDSLTLAICHRTLFLLLHFLGII